ncbi:hypothetical protein ACHAW6_011238 [Cyclotella cf. meneghiniana]
MEAIGSGYRPVTLSWQMMFQQLKDIHDLGHASARIPPRIIRWMSTQQRQYRVYGIGLKEPVGIIKHRIKKLNSLGFEWNPSLVNSSDRMKEVEYEEVEQTPERPNETSSASKDIEEKQNPSGKRRERDNSTCLDIYSGSVTGITQRGPGKKWEVRVSLNGGKRKYIGSYETHEEAIEALNRAQGRSAEKTKGKLQNRTKENKQWQVHLHRCGKSTQFGCYQTPTEAAEAVRQAKRKFKVGTGTFVIKNYADRKNRQGITLRGHRPRSKGEVRQERKQRVVGCFETQTEVTDKLRRARNAISENRVVSSSLGETPFVSGKLQKSSRRDQEADRKNERSQHDDESIDENDEDSYGAEESVEAIEQSSKCSKNEETAESIKAVNRLPSSTGTKLELVSSKKMNHLTQIKGITQRRNRKWEVRFFHKGVRRYIGSFNNQADALRALQQERKKVKIEEPVHSNENHVEEVSNDSESVGHQNEEDDDDTSEGGSVEANESSEEEEEANATAYKSSPGHSYFPQVVFKMVNDSSLSSPEILEWLPCGSAFRVKDHDKIGQVLSNYFRHSQYKSFHRMLNLYGFTKHTSGKYEGAFKHPHFHRDKSTEETIVSRIVKASRKGVPTPPT